MEREPLQWRPGEKPPFTFCEPVWASGHGLWCIRRTTDVGPKFGGGVDTPSLCGRVKETQGWDLEVRISEHHIKHNACRKCREMYLKLVAAEKFYDRVYDLLVEIGAPADAKADFLQYFMADRAISEWRFQGKLGFGGKFWRSARGHEITCYNEDSSKGRDELIARTNRRINELVAELLGGA